MMSRGPQLPAPETAMNRPRPSPDPAVAARPSAGDVVRALPVRQRDGRDDVALVAGLRAGEAWARAALFDRYAPHVERILRRVLGNDRHGDMADLVQEAF